MWFDDQFVDFTEILFQADSFYSIDKVFEHNIFWISLLDALISVAENTTQWLFKILSQTTFTVIYTTHFPIHVRKSPCDIRVLARKSHPACPTSMQHYFLCNDAVTREPASFPGGKRKRQLPRAQNVWHTSKNAIMKVHHLKSWCCSRRVTSNVRCPDWATWPDGPSGMGVCSHSGRFCSQKQAWNCPNFPANNSSWDGEAICLKLWRDRLRPQPRTPVRLHEIFMNEIFPIWFANKMRI